MLQALPALEGALAGNGAFLASLVGVLCPLLPLLRGIVGRREYVATEWDARAALIGVPAALTLAGWCASGTGYLAAVAACYKALCVAILPACCAVQAVVKLFGTKIQTHSRSEPVPGPKVWSELGETLLCFYVVACIAAWPARAGWPLVAWGAAQSGSDSGSGSGSESVPGSVSVSAAGYAARGAQVLAVMLAADMYTYFKHRLLHTRALYAYHKSHHVYGDPSCFSAFAQHPVEGVLTFWPIVLFGLQLPRFAVYGPLHMPTLAGFALLNLYLHCGYSVRWLDRLLRAAMLDTSALHNRHHETSRCNFGEVLVVWDVLMGTCDDHDARSHAKPRKPA